MRCLTRLRLGLLAAASATLVLMIAPAQGHAIFKFGSKLDPTVQPSNASTAHPCDDSNPSAVCNWVMNEAYGRPDGGHKAPRRGVIRRIRVIAGEAGSFRLQIARVIEVAPGDFQSRIVRRGPVISYQGDPDGGVDDVYPVEAFRVRVKVRKGDVLAIKTAATSALRCSSGGPNTLLYTPPLPLRGPFETPTSDDGCWELLEAVAVRPRKRRRN